MQLQKLQYEWVLGKKVYVRPKVVVKDLYTGEVKKVIRERKYRIREKVIKHIKPRKPRRVKARTVMTSSGGFRVVATTDKKAFKKLTNQQ